MLRTVHADLNDFVPTNGLQFQSFHDQANRLFSPSYRRRFSHSLFTDASVAVYTLRLTFKM